MPLHEAGAVGFLAFSGICLTYLAFTLLWVISPWPHTRLMKEDGLVENLTAVISLLASVAFFIAAYRQRGLPRFALALLATGMAFIFGEEITWGQRILEFGTPDFLSSNTQGEASIHNLPEFTTVSTWDIGLMVPCIFAIAGALGRRDAMFGVPLPSLPLALGGVAVLLLLPEHRTYSNFFYTIGLQTPHVLLLIVGIWAVLERHAGLFLAVAAIQTFGLAIISIEKGLRPRHDELMEMLTCLFWLSYAVELLFNRGGAARPGGAHGSPLVLGRMWLPAGCLLLALSVGLLAFDRLVAPTKKAEHRRALFEEARLLAEPGSSAVGAAFDVKLHRGRVAYFKRPCSQADIDAGHFFLHVRPQHPANLPRDMRKPYGFVNWDFTFAWLGAVVGDACGAVVPLPDYPIAWIRTGQFTAEGWPWHVERLVAPAKTAEHRRGLFEEARRLIKPGAPAVGAAFDVKLHRGRVAYFKRPCSQADIDAGHFFLHVRPQHPANLPRDMRKPYGFVNWDFTFAWLGAVVGDACGAVVPLPDYPIAWIRTGQYTIKGERWSVRLSERPAHTAG